MSIGDRPFLGRQAVRRGQLTAHALRRDHRRIYRNVYLRNDVVVTPLNRALAAWLWSGGTAILTGLTAAAVHGTKWLDAAHPAELNRLNRRHPPGIIAHSYDLAVGETCLRAGMRITTPARTAFDIGCTLPSSQAVPILDALVRATGVAVDDVAALADVKPGARGVRRLQSMLPLIDGGAESPPESRLRLLLVRAGLPAPETQIQFFDEYGRAFIRVDMGWRQWKVAVEYDGAQHWSDRYQRSWDIDRIATLEEMGWVVVRVSAELLSRPHVVVDQVRAKLRAAGCPI
ncbi:DUF559 domain-containing protein [Mycobacterium sp. M1]|uniref:DUF559 domain-containing protein n=1 Tax=Mycolicibacter acidiphilus TaxID=2835306 RepID=A0ABS5RF51_9MYCO|nr:DUF559 domain-containing protein [Mycolicibacter acidiphilus]MBS9532829.1 DUF559 domain-containing protein [Mycolicibacter acidiphilus]